jgi:hypothetical protein
MWLLLFKVYLKMSYVKILTTEYGSKSGNKGICLQTQWHRFSRCGSMRGHLSTAFSVFLDDPCRASIFPNDTATDASRLLPPCADLL